MAKKGDYFDHSFYGLDSRHDYEIYRGQNCCGDYPHLRWLAYLDYRPRTHACKQAHSSSVKHLNGKNSKNRLSAVFCFTFLLKSNAATPTKTAS